MSNGFAIIVISFKQMEDFINWLNEEIKDRGWVNSELARRAEISTSLLSLVLLGKHPPSWEFCAAVADALLKPREYVLRKAGYLSPLPVPEGDPLLQEVIDVTKQFDSEGRRDILEYARLRYKIMRERSQSQELH